ncbi:MAG: L,D-transpeptidase family protein [Bacteroidales bacterium]|nr:L,D-transpeptidase family protein [Bacteroidales bacterium]
MSSRLFVLLSILMTSFGTAAFAESDIWSSLLNEYAHNDSVQQMIFVKCTEGCKAEAEFYTKDARQQWVLERADSAQIGKMGLGKMREGDKKTPEGDFGIRQAFGIKANPGTVIPYLDVTENLYACDNEEYYNQFVDCDTVDHKCTGEHMIKYVPSYHYGIAIDYNHDNVFGLGSAIFFHCFGNRPYTAGCVAVAEDFMELILKKSDTNLKICIHQK